MLLLISYIGLIITLCIEQDFVLLKRKTMKWGHLSECIFYRLVLLCYFNVILSSG